MAWEAAPKGFTPLGESPKVRNVAYVFTMLRQLNGIDFLNAGLKVTVHRSGLVSAIRVGGAEVESKENGTAAIPQGSGFVFARTVESEAVRSRFNAEFPGARVDWDEVRYALPELERRALIEPRRIFSFSQATRDPSGKEIISRRKYLAYSLRNEAEPPTDLSDPAMPDAVGDSR